jgi:hypothetical protein
MSSQAPISVGTGSCRGACDSARSPPGRRIEQSMLARTTSSSAFAAERRRGAVRRQVWRRRHRCSADGASSTARRYARRRDLIEVALDGSVGQRVSSTSTASSGRSGLLPSRAGNLVPICPCPKAEGGDWTARPSSSAGAPAGRLPRSACRAIERVPVDVVKIAQATAFSVRAIPAPRPCARLAHGCPAGAEPRSVGSASTRHRGQAVPAAARHRYASTA